MFLLFIEISNALKLYYIVDFRIHFGHDNFCLDWNGIFEN